MSNRILTVSSRLRASLAFVSAIAGLIVLLGLGLATLKNMLDGPDDWREEMTAARTPDLPVTWAAIRAFPADARAYLKNRWALKDEFVRLDTRIKLALFGILPSLEVMRGQDGFLFLEGDVAVGSYIGLPPLTAEQIASWERFMQRMRAETDIRNIDFVFVLGPSKHSAYADKLPGWLSGTHLDTRRHDVLLDLGRQHLEPPPIDLYTYFEAFRRRNPTEQIYFATDSHWNEHGAALAAHAALESLGVDLPSPGYEARVTTNSGDLARIVGLSGDWTETVPVYQREMGYTCRTTSGAPANLQSIDPAIIDVVRCESETGHDLRVLSVMDSYGVAAEPYIASNFRESVFVRTHDVDFALIDEIDPDILIQFFAERKAMLYDPDVAIHNTGDGDAQPGNN
jgi:alginate O-acetyltransferase complex protein AlgJ